jgi:hypothetical protein
MADARERWIKLLVVAVLMVGTAATVALAQSAAQTGSLTGKLTDLYSAPLAGVSVSVRNDATGAMVRTTTARNGTYRFTDLGAGTYTLEADSDQLGRGMLQGIQVDSGHEARVNTAMRFEPIPVRSVQLASQDIPPGAPMRTAGLPVEPTRTLPLVAEQGLGIASEIPRSSATAAISSRAIPSNATPTGTSPSAVAEATPAAVPTAVQPGASARNVWSGNQGAALGAAALSVVQSAMQLGQVRSRSRQAASESVDPVSPVVTTTVSAEQVQSLPVSGRRWQDFVLDTPTASTQAAGSSQTALRGAGQEPPETTVDGASTRLAFGGQGASQSTQQGGSGRQGMGQSWNGGRGLNIAEAAIRSVQTEAGNVEAEAARAAGGRMNVATMRGSNGLHGQAFYFDRENIWGARNPFTQWVKETAPATLSSIPVFTPESFTPPDHETTWGIGLGSQIRRNKLFWFAALDGYRRNDPGISMVKHPDQFFAQPSNDQMQVLSARLALSGVNPVAEGVSAYSSMLETLDGMLGPAPRTATQWVGFGRLDWEATERHRFTLEAIAANWNSPGGGLTRVSENYGSHSLGSSQASEQWLLGRWEAFLTPNLLAVTQVSTGRAILHAKPEAPTPFEQTFLTGNTWGQLPQIVVDSRYGFTIGNPSRFGQGSYPDEHLYQAQESVDWVHGSLLVKAGFDASHNADSTSLLRNQTGTYYYSSVENFASDALAFQKYGLSDALDPANPHNCDQTGKVWRDSAGGLRGLGNLPCYSYYSQTMGPTNWNLSTNDWAGFVTTQWQASKLFVLSAGLRWEREQLPPPIAALANPQLPLTEKLPNLGNDWGPRISLAVGSSEDRKRGWPVLRLGYGMYYGRTENATLETALTQTGSFKGDLNFFSRPTDNLNSGGAPPFPYVYSGEPLSLVKPAAIEFAPNFRNPEVHQAVAAVEENLPGRVQLTASALVSLGRHLPISIDTNLAPPTPQQTITYAVVDGTGAGPIKAPQITVPFYASWPASTGVCPYYTPTNSAVPGRPCPDYQQISEIMSRANSTYEAAMIKLTRYGRRGLSLNVHYTYSHAMDWNPNESTSVAGSDVLDPTDFRQEYGVSNLDVRHSAAAMVIYQAPWKLHNLAGHLANGWMVSGIGQFRSGLPYTMRTSGSLPEEFEQTTGSAIVGLAPGMNGSGGDNRVYGVYHGPFNNINVPYNIGRNTFRYPYTWKADLRLGKSFNLGGMRKLELLAESFNLFNHQNVTELETTGYTIGSGTTSGGLPTLNFLTGLKTNTTAFGLPLNINATNFYRERQFQFGARVRF